ARTEFHRPESDSRAVLVGGDQRSRLGADHGYDDANGRQSQSDGRIHAAALYASDGLGSNGGDVCGFGGGVVVVRAIKVKKSVALSGVKFLQYSCGTH